MGGRAEPHPHLDERWPGGAAQASRPNPGWPARPRHDAHADHAAAALLGERRGRGTPVTYRGATAATMSGSFTQRNCTHAASAPAEDECAEPVRRFSLGTLAPAGSAPPEKAFASLAPPPVREQLPFALRRLHPDGGSEFINWQLFAFCEANQIALMQILAEAGVNLRVTIDRSQRRSDSRTSVKPRDIAELADHRTGYRMAPDRRLVTQPYSSPADQLDALHPFSDAPDWSPRPRREPAR